MALWYDNGYQLVKAVGMAKQDLGADVYLCCPGPSLANVDPATLRVPGVFTIALNTAYPKIRPDLWVGMDRSPCYHPRLWWEAFPKIVRGPFVTEICNGVPLKRAPNVLFADVEEAHITDIFRRRADDTKFVWNNNTFVVALHLAVWLGTKKIHLLGCDFGGVKDYHDGRILTDERRKTNQRLYRQIVDQLPVLRDAAKLNGVEVISCTPDSPANKILGYLPLDKALTASQLRVPGTIKNDVLHAADANLCRWTNSSPVGDGIIMGVDSHFEWVLPWWWEHYSQHNNLPVAFADFGMSESARARCARRGTVIDVPKLGGKTWHRKPFAILASPFQRSIWVDADCEVRGDLSAMLPYANLGTGVTIDPHNPWCQQPGAVTTGVVVCSHGETAVIEWAKEVLLREYRSDQEALNAIRGRLSERLVIMPPNFQRLRLDQDRSDAVVMHWTGEEGKRIIRERMNSGYNVTVDGHLNCVTTTSSDPLLSSIRFNKSNGPISISPSSETVSILDFPRM